MHKLHKLGCNNATIPIGKSFSGNIIPNDWYKKITNNSGRPDLAAIMVLAEIVYWYRPGKDGNNKFKDDAWQTSYEYFENKFGHNRQKIRRTFVRLEELGFIKRELRIIKHYGQKYGNVLFIHLNSSNSSPQTDIDKGNIEDKKISNEKIKNDIPLLQNCSDNIDIENKPKRNRSNFSIGKSFEDFYPISNSDLEILCKNSNREFDLNAANEILLSLAKKLPNHKFQSHKSFINYMSKALLHEMRQAEKVNNKEFKINLNKSDMEKQNEERDRYLDQIEASKNNDPLSLLKKKIIGRFDDANAFKIIKSLKAMEVSGDGARIVLAQTLNLSENESNILRREAEIVSGKNKTTLHFPSTPPKVKDTKGESSSLWYKIRCKAKEKLGEDIDNSWFSRINIKINEKNNAAIIEADSSFIRDWVENNYKSFISNQLKVEGIILEKIC